MNEEQKVKSADEVKDEFLSNVKNIVWYWKNEKHSFADAVEGVAFSILVAIDGHGGLPKFILAPDPHPDDRQYHIDNFEDFYPENYSSDIQCDISGELHDLFFGGKSLPEIPEPIAKLQQENTALKLENERLKEANAILLKMH